jgi:hypothetical protein
VLRHIDLLVLAARYEELPSVLIEAMAAGLPIIASRVGGIPALVDHDVNGLLVPPGRPRSGVPGLCWPARSPRSTCRWQENHGYPEPVTPRSGAGTSSVRKHAAAR